MVGLEEEMISAINGHDVKFSKSEQLKNDVEEWLKKKGNKIENVECTIVEVKRVDKDLSPHNRKNQKQFLKRIKVQQPFLAKFRKVVGVHAFSMLSNAIGGIIRPSFLIMVKDGENSIKCPDKWKRVKLEANKILNDLKNNS